MLKKLSFLIVVIIIFSNNIKAKHAEHVEIFFEITSSNIEAFNASALAPTFVPPTIFGNLNISITISPNDPSWEGFNFLFECLDSDCGYPIMRYGIYKIWPDDHSDRFFYYDTRDCNYMTYSDGPGGTPDVTFTFDVSTGDVLFEFWDWMGIGNNFLINEDDTINVWWSQIEDPQENPITHPHLYDVEPIEDCVMIFV